MSFYGTLDEARDAKTHGAGAWSDTKLHQVPMIADCDWARAKSYPSLQEKEEKKGTAQQNSQSTHNMMGRCEGLKIALTTGGKGSYSEWPLS